MMTPEREASAAKRLERMSLSNTSSSEEKKSMEDGDAIMKQCFQSEFAMDKKRMGPTTYRNMVSNEPGSKFLPEKNRYVLYVSRACPNSHCALMIRALKGLEDTVAVKYVYPHKTTRNWMVAHEIPDDSLASLKSDEGEVQTVAEIYNNDDNSSNINVIPLLFDQEHHCIVNNNANDIATMLNSAFNSLATNPNLELFPSKEAELQDWLYPLLQLTPSNVPPYHYNLSPRQLDYAFQRATAILQKQRYLLSNTSMSAADVRLFAALVRYDAVYAQYLEQPPQLLHSRALMEYCRDIYQQPGVAETVRMDDIQQHFLGYTKGDDALTALLTAPHKRHLL